MNLSDKLDLKYSTLVYTAQVNNTFRARWLANSEVISQVLFTSEQPKKNKIAFVAIFSQIKLLFGPLVIQLVWYILKQLFTSVLVKVVNIYLHLLKRLKQILEIDKNAWIISSVSLWNNTS